MDGEPAPRAPEYPFTEWQRRTRDAVRRLKGRPRACGLNAFRCLERAWLIAALDPEMSLLRAVTAEEEAATALIFALQQKVYPGSGKLNHRQHAHKAGIYPFLRIVEGFLAECGFPAPEMTLRIDGAKPRMELRFPVGGGLFAQPDEPLNGVTHENPFGEPRILDFGRQAQDHADVKGAADMLDVIRREANLRNRLLYATDEGINVVSGVDGDLLARGKPVTLLLGLAIAVLQTPMHQLFAVQVLEGYLKAIKKVPEDPFDYASALSGHVRVTRMP